ncbi:hypothetical protein ABTY63_33760 [Streptomyces solisilvae]|uniref:hypothetical protein n=2 Tax=Streptomyces malaysiensis TaxID=92644 RepID=UPI00332B1675
MFPEAGVPLFYGGPHVSYIAARKGGRTSAARPTRGSVSMGDTGRPARRLALQAREQHIRRAKATLIVVGKQVSASAERAGRGGLWRTPVLHQP